MARHRDEAVHGDFRLLEWATSDSGARFGLIVLHTDAEHFNRFRTTARCRSTRADKAIAWVRKVKRILPTNPKGDVA